MTEPSVYDRLQHYMPLDDAATVRAVAERIEHTVSAPLHAHAALLVLVCTMQAPELADNTSLGAYMSSVCDSFLAEAANYASAMAMLSWACVHFKATSLGDTVPTAIAEFAVVNDSCATRHQGTRLDLFYRAMSTVCDLIHTDALSSSSSRASPLNASSLDFELLHQWRGGTELTGQHH